MSADALLDALQPYKLRKAGTDRYRAICPVCGERNANTLSVGLTAEGAVLLRCFKSECDVERIVGALGLDLADLFPPRESHGAPPRRRRLLTAGQALDLLNDEALLVAVAAANLGNSIELTDDDRARVLQAAGRIGYLAAESRS